MRQAPNIRRLVVTAPLCGLLGLGWAGSSAAASVGGGDGHFDLGQWRQVLSSQLDPGFEGMELHSAGTQAAASGSWIHKAQVSLLPDFAQQLFASSSDRRITSFNRSTRVDNVLDYGGIRGTAKTRLNDSSLKRQFIEPGVVGRISDHSVFSAGMVLASQRYGTADLGFRTTANYHALSPSFEPAAYPRLFDDVSSGTGVRLGFSSLLLPRVGLNIGYRSRIDMEGLSSLRGVYADPAELDVPERVAVGLQFGLGDGHELHLSSERVMYSDVNAFPSRFLPARFLSLLGDSNSPEFDWRDLTMYKVGWNWQPSDDWSLRVEYSTRSQPLPTSGLLADALRPELADDSYIFSLSRRFGVGSELRLSAAYAPPEYAFGGNVLGVVTDELDHDVEVDLSLNWSF